MVWIWLKAYGTQFPPNRVAQFKQRGCSFGGFRQSLSPPFALYAERVFRVFNDGFRSYQTGMDLFSFGDWYECWSLTENMRAANDQREKE